MAQGFESFGLNPRLLQAVREMGFHEAFPIQTEAIAPLLKGRDLIGQAQTGSGKKRVEPHSREIQGLVLVPTRELAVQVAGEFERLAKHLPSRTMPIYGGSSMRMQIEQLRRGYAKIVVATPGRLLDHLKRRTVDLHGAKFVVIDEADRMLDMGFIDDVKSILENVPRGHQTALFSATMPNEVVKLSQRYLSNPLRVFVDSEEIAVESLRQSYVTAEEDAKFPVLIAILKTERMEGALVRVGRTARAGKKGTSISLVSREDHDIFNSIKNMTGTTIEQDGRFALEGTARTRFLLPSRPARFGGRGGGRRKRDHRGRQKRSRDGGRFRRHRRR